MVVASEVSSRLIARMDGRLVGRRMSRQFGALPCVEKSPCIQDLPGAAGFQVAGGWIKSLSAECVVAGAQG